MVKKCSVHKPWWLRNLKFFLSFSCYNFEDTATYLDTDMLKKESFLGTNFYSKVKTKFKSVFIYLSQYIKLRKQSEIY